MQSTRLVTAVLCFATAVAAQNPTPAPSQGGNNPGRVRCLTPGRGPTNNPIDNPDCDANQTNPSSTYAMGPIYQIPVVVHVIQNSSGTGYLSATLVQSQIQVLNEDFRAMAGTNGANGTDTGIEFYLATVDPNGLATTGITYSTNTTWFNDGGSYYTSLAWDTNHYLNIYTNTASGALGYVPSLPQGGLVGSSQDRVVIAWDAFGSPALGGAPYDTGRTATHEVGHYLGLYHTFEGGCAAVSGCYSNGDLICDTNAESAAVFGCPGSHTSCSTSDPFHNYMDYTDDGCMTNFTAEQALRMRCTLTSYRPVLATALNAAVATARQGAGDPNIYSASPPVLGGSCNAVVALFGSGWTNTILLIYTGAASFPFGTYGTVLVDITTPLIYQSPVSGNGLYAQYLLPVPSNAGLAGFTISSQMVLFGGNPDFGFTNAVDLTLGY